MKLNEIWVVADNAACIAELMSAAIEMGENVSLIYAGAREAAVGASKAYWMGELEEDSFINYISAITGLIKQAKPELVLCSNSSNGRLVAAHIAASNDTATMSDVSSISIDKYGVTARRMVYGGAAIKTEKSEKNAAVVILNPGVFEIRELAPAENVEKLQRTSPSVTLLEKSVKTSKNVNLAGAKRVVAVGRGLPSKEFLIEINEFAGLLKAEIGCTRPIAEEGQFLPKELYIGVSGVMMKPEIYVGVGVSGQIQHTVGINSAKTIFAINKDKNAPIFNQCDYGIVGDISTVVPALIEALK